MNCIFMNQLNSERGQTLTEVENKIDEGKDNQSIHQTINQSINQISSQSIDESSINQSNQICSSNI